MSRPLLPALRRLRPTLRPSLRPSPRLYTTTPTPPAPRIRQPPNSPTVHFPGAVRSEFTSTLTFTSPDATPAMSTYRILNADGQVVDMAGVALGEVNVRAEVN